MKHKEKTVNLHKNIKSMFDGLDVQFQALSEEMIRQQERQLRAKTLIDSMSMFEDVVIRLANLDKLPEEIRSNPELIKIMRRQNAKHETYEQTVDFLTHFLEQEEERKAKLAELTKLQLTEGTDLRSSEFSGNQYLNVYKRKASITGSPRSSFFSAKP